MRRTEETNIFPALLKYWRQKSGMSQLDLALAAEVSPKHVSFLETGRARPSKEMVLQLASTLGLSLRDQNALLDAAGFPKSYPEPSFSEGLPFAIERVIDRMFAQQEPYPMVALDRRYDIIRSNDAANRLLFRLISDPSSLTAPLNLMRALFDPRLCRPFIVEWEKVARTLLSRFYRESLGKPHDEVLKGLFTSLLAYPDVPRSFRTPDLSMPSEPMLVVRFARDDLRLAFLTTVTVFDAPQNVTLSELRLESYFPLDRETEEACARLAREED